VFSLWISLGEGPTPIIIVGIVFLLNVLFFKGQLISLYFAFVFLDAYSLVWGGDLLFIQLDESTIDITFTSAAKYLGYILVALALFSGRLMMRFNLVDATITLFALLMLLSPFTAGFSSEKPEEAVPQVIQFFTLYLLTRLILRSEHDVYRFFQFIIISFVPIFFVVSLQYFSGYFGTGYDKGRPGELAAFIPYLLGLGALIRGKGLWFLITVPITIFLTTFHGSRRILIEVIGYLGLHFKVSIFSFVLAGFLVLSGSFLFEQLPETTRERLELTFNTLSSIRDGDTSDDSLNRLSTGRWQLLQSGLDMWSNAPIFGIGLDNNAAYMGHYDERGRNLRVHNYYAEVLVDLGIVGLLLLIIVVVTGFTLLRKFEAIYVTRNAFLSAMLKAYKYQFLMIHIVALFGS